jgi:hypothetical protein
MVSAGQPSLVLSGACGIETRGSMDRDRVDRGGHGRPCGLRRWLGPCSLGTGRRGGVRAGLSVSCPSGDRSLVLCCLVCGWGRARSVCIDGTEGSDVVVMRSSSQPGTHRWLQASDALPVASSMRCLRSSHSLSASRPTGSAATCGHIPPASTYRGSWPSSMPSPSPVQDRGQAQAARHVSSPSA